MQRGITASRMRGVVNPDPAGNIVRMTFQSTERRISVPGRIWYVVAGLIFLAGMAAFAVFLYVGLSKLDDDFVRVTAPGQAELPLEPGAYTILYERGGITDTTGGGVIISADVTGLRISLQRSETGATVPLTATTGGSYSLDSRSGQSLFAFTLTEPGTYRLAAAYDDGRAGPQAMLAISRGFTGTLWKTVLGSLEIGLGGSMIALTTGFYVYRRRRSALGPLPDVPIWKSILAFYLDAITAFLLGGLIIGLLAAAGSSLLVWWSPLMLAVIVGYFVFSHWLFGGTLWQHILKTRRPGIEA
jgi:hypothetical protein